MDLNDGVCADIDGACSLKAAVQQANDTAGVDTINFNIPGGGPFLIEADQLTITDSVIIDATTQPGYAGKPLIEVNLDVGSFVFALEADNSTLRGLSITGAAESGVFISGEGNLVESNYIGVKTDGLSTESNRTGVFVTGSFNTIHDNVISGNTEDGVVIVGAPGDLAEDNVIDSNKIGVDFTGLAAVANQHNGISIELATGTEVTDNVISGNAGHGVSITGISATNNSIQGNIIGANVDGTAAVANGMSGISIFNAPDNTIGGLAAPLGQAPGNLISGNNENGIIISGGSAKDNNVLGNIIGEDKTGSNAVSNKLSGVLIENAPDNTIGGAQGQAANVIGGNLEAGVKILGAAASGNGILGNFIGVGAGNTPLGNEQGVLIENAQDNFVGGAGAGEGNRISANRSFGVEIRNGSGNSLLRNWIGGDIGKPNLSNGGHGVQIQGADNKVGDIVGGAVTGNAIRYNKGSGVVVVGLPGVDSLGNQIRFNSMQKNELLGIDLNDDGPTANDPLDADAGQNRQQNYPVLFQIENLPAGALVTGELDGAPLGQYHIDFYRNTDLDPSGFGEGETFLGRIGPLAADAAGKLAINVNLGMTLPAGAIVVAMATDATTNDSSEFSAPAVVSALLDFGDAPDALPPGGGYPTLLANNGARHVTSPEFHLGARVDDELNGQPDSNAAGDDLSADDDEDGVSFDTLLVQDGTTDITVNASAAGKLDAWIDLNADGDWNDENEQIFTSFDISAGDNLLSISVPAEALAGETFARFRFSSAGGLSPSGLALDGEVEDYKVRIHAPAEWRNDENPLDVNDDGDVTPLDALLVINWLNRNGAQALPHPEAGEPPPYLDASGDNTISPLDALLMINFLNRASVSSMALSDMEGEGESSDLLKIDNFFAAEAEYALSAAKDSNDLSASKMQANRAAGKDISATEKEAELASDHYPARLQNQNQIMESILSDVAEDVSGEWDLVSEEDFAFEEEWLNNNFDISAMASGAH